MTRILLYSDFRPSVSGILDDCYLKLLNGTKCRIGYIPSESDLKRRYFKKVQDHYNELGITTISYFDLGEEFDKSEIPKLLDCDAIHLSGGDPVRFMQLINSRGFGEQLKKFIRGDGIIVGVSAGAMILSRSLGLLQYCDDAGTIAKVPPALRCFEFEFFPHFKKDAKTTKILGHYATSKKTLIYACDDDAGVFIHDSDVTTLGDVSIFEPV